MKDEWAIPRHVHTHNHQGAVCSRTRRGFFLFSFLLPVQRCGNWSMPHLQIPHSPTPGNTHFGIRNILSWRQFSRGRYVFIIHSLPSACLPSSRMCFYKGTYLLLPLPGRGKARYPPDPMQPGRYWGTQRYSPAPPATDLGCAPAHVSCPRTRVYQKCHHFSLSPSR